MDARGGHFEKKFIVSNCKHARNLVKKSSHIEILPQTEFLSCKLCLSFYSDENKGMLCEDNEYNYDGRCYLAFVYVHE